MSDSAERAGLRSSGGAGGVLSYRGPYQPSDRRNSLITANIVLAFLECFPILQRPPRLVRKFAWFQAVVADDDVARLSEDGGNSAILYLCTEGRALEVLDGTSGTFVVVVSRTGEVPDWAARYRNRVIIIQSNDRLIYISSIVQNLFTNMLVWEGALDRIVSARQSLADLIDEGTRALGCFMAVTDSGFNDIAHSSQLEPPTNAFAQLVKTGCYTPDMIAHIENDVLPKCREAKSPVIDPRRHGGEPDLIHFPLYNNGEYYFHLAMACGRGTNPYAACDLMAIFASRFSALCTTFWEDLIMLQSPWHRVLTNLIDGVPMHEKYIATQLSLTEIPNSRQLCLLCFDLKDESTPTMRSHVTEAAAKLNGGACYPFAYNGRLLVLCYSTSEAAIPFSIRTFADDIGNHIPSSSVARTGVSKTFHDIGKLHVAFTQAMIAINFSSCIDAECALSGQEHARSCYSFDSVLPYYLLVTSMHDNALTSQSVSQGILGTLAAEDRASGSEIVKLLWTFLCLERNATAASKQLHMHRNTVLYHVEKIEKRFSIDLGDLIMRMNLLDEFRMFFLTDGFTKSIDYEEYTAIRRYQERPLL